MTSSDKKTPTPPAAATRARPAPSEEPAFTGFVRVRGAREHNLKNIDVEIPRDALVVFTGVSGSGKSSLAFGTLYAEAQRRYFESVAPYARRLIEQVGVPEVDAIEGLPPAVALAAAARHAERALVGWQRHHAVESRAHALFAHRQLSAEAAHAVRRGFLAEHGAGRLPDLSRTRPRVRGHRKIDGARRLADHSRARDRRMAARVARTESARHPRDARLRRRHAVARFAEERPRLDSLHRRTADRARLRRPHAEGNARRAQAQGGAKLPGHIHRRAPLRAAHVREHAKRADEKARLAIHDRQRMSGVPRQAAEEGSAVGDVRRARYRRVRAACRSRASPRSSSRSRAANGPTHAARATTATAACSASAPCAMRPSSGSPPAARRTRRRPTCGARRICRRKSASPRSASPPNCSSA